MIYVVGSFVVACCAKLTRLPRAGETLDAAAFAIDPGGKGFNVAVAACRLGVKVSGVFGIGRDIFGTFAEQTFAHAGLSPAMLVRYDTTTGCGIGFTDLAGENCIAVHPGANARVSAADVEACRGDILAADMVLAQFESPDAPIRAAFATARGRGRPTLLNPSPCREIDPDLLALTSILVMNESEAGQLAGECGSSAPGIGSSPQRLQALAAELMRHGPDLVVVTLGVRGATAFPRDQPPVHQPAFRVEVQDTIGCGDAFTAGLAVALLAGRPVAESLRRAAACGAIVAGRFGVFDALPDAAELDAFLECPDLALVPAREGVGGPPAPATP